MSHDGEIKLNFLRKQKLFEVSPSLPLTLTKFATLAKIAWLLEHVSQPEHVPNCALKNLC